MLKIALFCVAFLAADAAQAHGQMTSTDVDRAKFSYGPSGSVTRLALGVGLFGTTFKSGSRILYAVRMRNASSVDTHVKFGGYRFTLLDLNGREVPYRDISISISNPNSFAGTISPGDVQTAETNGFKEDTEGKFYVQVKQDLYTPDRSRFLETLESPRVLITVGPSE